MRKGLFAVLILALVVMFAMPVMAGPSDTYLMYPKSADPCQNPSITKKSVAVAIQTTTVTSLISAVTGKKVYICQVVGTGHSASVGTLKLWSGITDATGACNTSKTALTGVMKMAAAASLYLGYGGSIAVSTPTSSAVCAEAGGAGYSFDGVISYVQQ
jgi:hypothetical protein